MYFWRRSRSEVSHGVLLFDRWIGMKELGPREEKFEKLFETTQVIRIGISSESKHALRSTLSRLLRV